MKQDEIKDLKLRDLNYDILFLVEKEANKYYGQPDIVEVSILKVYTDGDHTFATVYYEYENRVVEDVPIEHLFKKVSQAQQFIRINRENIRKDLANLNGVGELFDVLDGKIKINYKAFYTKEDFHKIVIEEFGRRLRKEGLLKDEK